MLLIDCNNWAEDKSDTIMYNLSTKEIIDAGDFKNTIPYSSYEVDLVQHEYNNKVSILSPKEETYKNEINLEKATEGELIQFADEQLLLTYNISEEESEGVYRIYSLKDGSLMFRNKLFDNDKYTYAFGDFSNNKKMAVIGLCEFIGENTDMELGKADLYIINLEYLTSLEKEESIYNNQEQLLKSISEKYGVNIFIGKDAMGNFPGFKAEVLEYEDQTIGALRALDEVFSKLPEGFYKSCVLKSMETL